MTLQDLYREGIRKLTENEVPEAKLSLVSSAVMSERGTVFVYEKPFLFRTDGAGGARDNNIIHGKSFQKRRAHSTGIHSWIYRVYGINFFGT